MIDLKIGNNCGSCVGCNSMAPKTTGPDTHAAHYTVAKTERWCFKHNIPTVREAVCDDYVLDIKKGAYKAYQRAIKQNKRLALIIEKADELKRTGESVVTNRFEYLIVNDKLAYRYSGHLSGSVYKVNCKDNTHDEFLGLKK